MSVVLTHNGRVLDYVRPGLSDLRALQFDGSANSYGIGGSLTLGGELSIECFIKPTAIAASQYMFGFGTNGSADRFYLTTVSGGGIKAQIFLRSTSGATLYSITSTTTLVNGSTYHICATYSDTTDTLRLFVNGVQEGGDLSVPSGGSLNNRVIQLAGASSGAFIGTIDNARFYRRALTISEVAQHYVGTFSDNSNLTVEWKMDNGFGTGVNDTSGNNNHGTIADLSVVSWVTRLVNF